ncbi:MAG: holo-ACP synthase [Deltaproteobacteria bacterium]|nr:holo-ACP synthase [Deltaproteobacteria bacterium]
MGVSTGIDIVSIERFAGRASDPVFLERLLTEEERADVLSKPHAGARLAVRFAAKEAVMKAMGTGWDKGVGWRDIEIVCAAGGRANVRLHAKAAQLAAGRRLLLSVSATDNIAAGFAILED